MRPQVSAVRVVAMLVAVLPLALLLWAGARRPPPAAAAAPHLRVGASPNQPPLPVGARRIETPHYRIFSSATPAQTAQVADAVEGLYRAYARVFGAQVQGAPPRLALVLYRDRPEFSVHNRSRPWAEAYYLPPRSHAYYAPGPNPYHWMLHEATHQLMRELSGFPRSKWSDEGLAAYFGASRMVDGELRPGTIDPDAYPIWWLDRYDLSGDLAQDIGSAQVIPLAQLIGDRGPVIDRHVNQYYVNSWSLAHFLMHYRHGACAGRFRRLVAAGGSLEDFRRLIGPVEVVQRAWYGYLLQLVRQARAGTLDRGVGAAADTGSARICAGAVAPQ